MEYGHSHHTQNNLFSNYFIFIKFLNRLFDLKIKNLNEIKENIKETNNLFNQAGISNHSQQIVLKHEEQRRIKDILELSNCYCNFNSSLIEIQNLLSNLKENQVQLKEDIKKIESLIEINVNFICTKKINELFNIMHSILTKAFCKK